MNIKLHDELSDLTGKSGTAVVMAILERERDPEKLRVLCDAQVQKRKAQHIKESLRGTWSAEHTFLR